MTNMLERIARELRAMTLRNGGRCRGDDQTGWRDYIGDAQRLLECIQEPSWPMNDAAFDAGDDIMHESGDRVRSELVWKLMIDAAIADKPPK